MERSDGEVLQLSLAEQALEPFLHLPSRLVRKGDGQDRPWRDAEVADQVGDAVRENARLPRTGAGQDEQRPFAVGDGSALLGIERVEDGVGHDFDGMCDSRLWMER